jgi:hypothetical protein
LLSNIQHEQRFANSASYEKSWIYANARKEDVTKRGNKKRQQKEILMLSADEGRPGETAIGTGPRLPGITLQTKRAAFEILSEFNSSASRIQGLVIRRYLAE